MTGGSWPSVFQTAPPQPYSKARMTCSPEFDGGAEASQNGFGDLIPAQSVERSAMVHQLTLRDGSHLAALDGRDPVIVARRQRLSGQQGALDGEGGPLAVGGSTAIRPSADVRSPRAAASSVSLLWPMALITRSQATVNSLLGTRASLP